MFLLCHLGFKLISSERPPNSSSKTIKASLSSTTSKPILSYIKLMNSSTKIWITRLKSCRNWRPLETTLKGNTNAEADAKELKQIFNTDKTVLEQSKEKVVEDLTKITESTIRT